MTHSYASADHQLKTLLARELCAIMVGWTQIGAAAMLGLRQQDVSRIRRGQLRGYSIARLVRLIAERHWDI